MGDHRKTHLALCPVWLRPDGGGRADRLQRQSDHRGIGRDSISSMAEGAADKIDRNLFERYGDVQAFGFNSVVDQKASWYRTDVEGNPIRQVIDQYVDTYDLYSLSIW